jgi:K+-sensing histidine kinase KdpD
VSHNLKTPLNSLIMNNEILQNQIEDQTSLAYDVVMKNKQNLSLLNFQISDILDFSRLYSNDFKPQYSYFRLDELLYQMRELFRD